MWRRAGPIPDIWQRRKVEGHNFCCLKGCCIRRLCDVDSPLDGFSGATKEATMRRAAFFTGMLIAIVGTSLSRAAEIVTLAESVAKPMQPQAAVGSDGTIYVAFGSGTSIYCAVSRDRGGHFESPVKVAELPKLA